MGGRGKTERKVKFLGVFITSECDSDAYAPLVQSNLGRYEQRALRVRVKVGDTEIAVKERGLIRWKTDRFPVRLLRSAHTSLAIPELTFFVVQTDDRRFKVLAFLCKSADDARRLVEVARLSRQLGDAAVCERLPRRLGSGDDYDDDGLRARSELARARSEQGSSLSFATSWGGATLASTAADSRPCRYRWSASVPAAGASETGRWQQQRWRSAAYGLNDSLASEEAAAAAEDRGGGGWRYVASDEADDRDDGGYGDDFDDDDSDDWSGSDALACTSNSWLRPRGGGRVDSAAASHQSISYNSATAATPSFGYLTAQRSTPNGTGGGTTARTRTAARSSSCWASGDRAAAGGQPLTLSATATSHRCRSVSDLSFEPLVSVPPASLRPSGTGTLRIGGGAATMSGTLRIAGGSATMSRLSASVAGDERAAISRSGVATLRPARTGHGGGGGSRSADSSGGDATGLEYGVARVLVGKQSAAYSSTR